MADQKTSIIISAVNNTTGAVDSAIRGLTGLEAEGSSLNATLSKIAPLLGAATFAGIIKGSIDSADAMHDLSTRTGISVEQLGAWKLASDQSGTSIDALANALDKGSKYLVEHADNVKKLGITATTSKELIFQLAGIIEKLPSDDPRRAALAMSVLGKSAGELLPLLSEGEAGLRKMVEQGEKLNPVTAEMARQADLFNDQLQALKLSSTGLFVPLVTETLPSLNKYLKDMRAVIQDGDWLDKLQFFTLGHTSAKIAGQTHDPVEQIKAYEASIKSLKAQLANFPNSGTLRAPLEKQLADAQAALDTQHARLSSFYADQITPKSANGANKNLQSTIDGVLGPQHATAAEKKSEVAKQAAEDYAKLYGELSNVLAGTDQLTKSEQTLRDIQSGRFGDLLPWQQDQLANLAQEVSLNEQLASFQKVLDEGDARQAEQDQAAADAAAAYDQKQIDSYTSMRTQILAENDDLNVSLITNDKKRAEAQLKLENDRAVQRIYDMQLEGNAQQDLLDEQAHNYELKQKELAQNSSKNIDLVKELGLTFTSSFEDAVASGKSLSDVLKGLEVDIEKILVRKSVTEPLGKAIDSIDFGSFFSGLFSSNAQGNAFAGAGIGAYSNTIVSQPTLFPFASGIGLMGEKPGSPGEAIMPLTRMSGGDLGVKVAGSQSNVTVNVIESPGNGGQVQRQQDGKGNEIVTVMVETVKREVARDISRGGVVAQSLQQTYALNRAPGA